MACKKIQATAIFLFLDDIKKLLTHSISPIIIVGGLTLTYDFCALKTERVVHVQYHHGTPLLVPCIGVMTMGHGSRKMTHFHFWW